MLRIYALLLVVVLSVASRLWPLKRNRTRARTGLRALITDRRKRMPGTPTQYDTNADAIHEAVDATVDNCANALGQVVTGNIPAAEAAVADAQAHHSAAYTAAGDPEPDTCSGTGSPD